jgi:carboxypeptidase Q
MRIMASLGSLPSSLPWTFALLAFVTSCSPRGESATASLGPKAPSRSATSAPSPPLAKASVPAPQRDVASTYRELLADGLASRRAADFVRRLTDEVGARPAGSEGDRLAVAWALKELARSGFDVHAEPVRVTRWERGIESARLLGPTPHELHVTSLGGSLSTPADGIQAELVRVRSLEEIDALDPKTVRGKILFVSVPTERAQNGEGYGKAVGVRWGAAERAANVGAAAVVIRSIGTDASRLPHTGSMKRPMPGKSVPAGALSTSDADLCDRLLDRGVPVSMTLTLTSKSLPEVTSANIIADYKGKVAPEEWVLLGAHLDSWDLGTGALDDGAGMAIVVEALSLIKAHLGPARRSLRVVLFANEESGLEGAKAYAVAHASELDKHIVAMEADFGTGSVYSTSIGGGPEALTRFAPIARLLEPLGVTLDEHESHGGADTSPLREAGVPTVDLNQEGATYFDFHHTANDTFDRIEPEHLAQAATTFAIMAHALADAPYSFGRRTPRTGK